MEPSLENRVDAESIRSPVQVFLPLRLRRCEPVYCRDERALFCALIVTVCFVARVSNGPMMHSTFLLVLPFFK